MDERFGVPAMLRQLADSIADGSIPVTYVNVSYLEVDDDDIAEGAEPDDVTLMVSIGTKRAVTTIPAAFYGRPGSEVDDD